MLNLTVIPPKKFYSKILGASVPHFKLLLNRGSFEKYITPVMGEGLGLTVRNRVKYSVRRGEGGSKIVENSVIYFSNSL